MKKIFFYRMGYWIAKCNKKIITELHAPSCVKKCQLTPCHCIVIIHSKFILEQINLWFYWKKYIFYCDNLTWKICKLYWNKKCFLPEKRYLNLYFDILEEIFLQKSSFIALVKRWWNRPQEVVNSVRTSCAFISSLGISLHFSKRFNHSLIISHEFTFLLIRYWLNDRIPGINRIKGI
jgi:hypothetical protein